MFNTFAYTALEAAQTTNKHVVDTFIQHKVLAKTINDFIDGQTAITKKALDSMVGTATNIGEIVTSKEFYEGIATSYKAWMPVAGKSK